MARYIIGTSGWHYADWRGRFYPDALPAAKWLEFYSSRFPTVEVNNSFYRLPTEAAVDGWYGQTPRHFIFSVKASRFITHIKRLKDTAEALATFTERMNGLKEKLGPLLYQLPPSMRRDDARLDSFLSTLTRHLRHVIEFRHESWFEPAVFDILRKHGVGLCGFDMPGLSAPVVATAPFAYMRFHGGASLYSSRYSDEELKSWAKKLTALAKGLDTVYVYFNNDVSGFALDNAATLQRLPGVS